LAIERKFDILLVIAMKFVLFFAGAFALFSPALLLKGTAPVATPPVLNPTYAEHVAPIINEHCVTCHRPGEVAPFSLVGYENAKKWAAMAHKVTATGQMPPWKAKSGYGEFQDENRLSANEAEILRLWSEQGAVRGDSKKEPPTPKFDSDWALGKPDLVVTQSKPYAVSPEGTDEYRNFVVTTSSKDPMWITAMDVKPGNTRIVHHVIVFLDNTGQSEKLAAQNKDGKEGYETFGGVGFLPSGSLGGWAPGMRARMLPTGKAFRVEPGARLVLQVHYNKSGKAESDLTRVGLYFAKKPVEQRMQLAWLFNMMLNIPANAKAHKQLYRHYVPDNITMYGVMPHMHLLGKEMKAWAELPDKSVVPLIHVQDWDFNWQLNYLFKKPVKIPKGSTIFVEATYDNSAENPNNPNSPPKPVHVGEKTTDEMQLLVAAYTVDGQYEASSSKGSR
jgi:hypothetical protein